MVNDVNLYQTLFEDDDDDDIGMLTINEMYDHLDIDKMSNYYDFRGYNSTLAQTDSKILSIFHFNIRSLSTNLHHLEVILVSLQRTPDILVFTETWLNPNNKDSININGYYSYNIVRENRDRGGVSIYVRQNIDSTILDKFSYVNEDFEICTIATEINNKNHIISAIYRPNSKHEKVDEFRTKITAILNTNTFKRTNVILTGDININLLEHTTHRPTNEYLNTLQSLNYIPLITRPTRFPEGNQNADPSLLDHIYVNFSTPLTAGILHHKVSDHLPIFLHLSLHNQPNVKQTIKFRSFTNHNKDLFTRSLSHVTWEEILTHDDVNQNFDIFFQTFKQRYDTHFPIKTKQITMKRINNPWIT